MKKFAVKYQKILSRTFIVEAESYEEAEEKVREKAENCEIEDTNVIENFDHWDVEPSDTFGTKAIPVDRDVSFFEHLEE